MGKSGTEEAQTLQSPPACSPSTYLQKMGEVPKEEPRTPPTPSAMEPSDETGEPFHCVICLELVYKPIVQSCGHVFCFWCVHRAMNIRRQSQCPVCRSPYMYFPRVCEALHFFLMKAVPQEYGRRSQEIQDMEEEKQIFSPRFMESPRYMSPRYMESPRHIWSPRKEEELDRVKSQLLNLPGLRRSKQQSRVGNLEDVSSVGHSAHQGNAESAGYDGRCSSHSASSTSGQEIETDPGKGKSEGEEELQNTLTVEDFLCASCNRFLYRPVVLNCGQVFCESCVTRPRRTVLSCPSCGDRHHGGSVHVCLEFHHYLERAFPTDYLIRKEEILSQDTPKESCTSEICDPEDVTDHRTEGLLHVGIGCDGCGMFPIVGDRYHCQDCAEKIGYDLCGTCYRTGASLSGRFNQQHTPGHRMEEVTSALPAPLILNIGNGIIHRRRHQQQLLDDLDDYIDSFIY